MASIVKKIKKGRPYYYAVESKRVDGKPRIVWQKYLGTVEAIINRSDQARPQAPKESVVFQAGGVAALLRITPRLGLLELINQVVPKREQGPSVGHYLLLAALNRALAPCSKLAISDWYQQTILQRLWRYPAAAFSSQHFWDHMDIVSEEAIDTIQETLLPRLNKEFALDSQILLYDTTNFFTFLATANDRACLPQRGRCKAKRYDLRQVGLALLVSRSFQVPLLHHTYAGNIPDVSLFPELAQNLIARYRKLGDNAEQATLVFDKGNVSDAAMENLALNGHHFVAALSLNRQPELLSIPLERFQDLPGMPGSSAFAASAPLWGKECRLVVVYTESFFTQQLAAITQNLVKCQKKLLDLSQSLQKWRLGSGRGKRPTLQSVRKNLQQILTPQFMKELIKIQLTSDSGLPKLQYAVDHNALQKLQQQRLGRTVLVSDRLDWTPREVVAAYRNLASVEEAFKNMKNTHFLRWQPAYHWTDQKIRVHSFYCVLALLFSTLAHQEAVRAGIDISLPKLLQDLSAIQEVAVIYPPGTLAHRKDHITLTRMSARQKKIVNCLQISNLLLSSVGNTP
jgi:transposase